MSTMKRAAAIFCVTIMLLTAATTALAASDSDDREEGVRVYFAVGGCVAAGIYIFIAYSSGLMDYNPMERSALINYGPDGWKPGLPMLQVRNTPTSSSPDYYLELLTVRF